MRIAPVRIVKEEAGERRRPIGKDALKTARGNRFMNAIVVISIKDAQSLKRAFEHDLLKIGNQRATHLHLNFFVLLLHLPAIDRSAPRKAPVDASVSVQIGWDFRLTV